MLVCLFLFDHMVNYSLLELHKKCLVFYNLNKFFFFYIFYPEGHYQYPHKYGIEGSKGQVPSGNGYSVNLHLYSVAP